MTPQRSVSVPALIVIERGGAGRRVTVSPGRSTIGRDPRSDIVITGDGVSRHHAVLHYLGGVVMVEDDGSLNGTWVNGRRIESLQQLVSGDELRIGAVTVRFEDTTEAAPSASPAPAPRRRRGVRLSRIVLVGGLANLVLLAAGVAIQYATDWTGFGPWLAAPLLGMVTALVDVARQAAKEEPTPPAAPEPGPPHSAGPPATSTGRIPQPGPRPRIWVGILVAVLLIGGGGLAVAYGVGTVSAFITGNQAGVERLVGDPVEDPAQGVTTTVHSIEHTRNFTRVEISVRNSLSNTITLPVFQNATLTSADGTTLSADPFRSSWNETIVPGQQSRGVLVFDGHLPQEETTAALAFATVFDPGFDGPNSIVVDGLAIAPLDG